MSTNLNKVYDIMKSSGRGIGTRYTGDFGVEIETETDKKYDYPALKYWEAKKDNSLRDWGVEYVLKGPMGGPELERALTEFQACDKKWKFKTSSVSTSVHVHVNMLNETYLTVANFMTAWVLLETMLIRYSGPDRLSNLFCLPVRDAEGLLNKWINLLSQINRNSFSKAVLNSEHVKYSALNAATLSTLGTLEVRSFRGETDIKVIQEWIDIIDRIKQFAADPKLTPATICKMYSENGPALVDIILKEHAKKLKATVKDIKREMDRDVWYAANLAGVSKDWSKFGILKVKPVYKEKIKEQLEAISQKQFNSGFDQIPYHERLIVYEIYHRVNPTNKIVDAQGDL
jgi:hypothetical protein